MVMTNCHNRVNFSKRLTYLMLTLLASFTESRYANLSQAWATEKKNRFRHLDISKGWATEKVIV